jgi:hypothetical protein
MRHRVDMTTPTSSARDGANARSPYSIETFVIGEYCTSIGEACNYSTVCSLRLPVEHLQLMRTYECPWSKTLSCRIQHKIIRAQDSEQPNNCTFDGGEGCVVKCVFSILECVYCREPVTTRLVQLRTVGQLSAAPRARNLNV